MANFGGQNVLLHSCIKCYYKSERSDLLVGRMRCYTVVSSVMISQKDLTFWWAEFAVTQLSSVMISQKDLTGGYFLTWSLEL